MIKYKEIPQSLRLRDFHGAPAGIRTPDTLLKRQVLYLLSYWGRSLVMRRGKLYKTSSSPFLGREPSGAGRGRKGDGLRRSELSSREGSGGRKKSVDVAGMAGLEPTISESKSGVLPLHYIPMYRYRAFAKRPDASDLFAVGWDMGLEPTTPGTTIRCSAN